ncbi:putative translation initiation factor IF-2, N-terminal region [Trypoxylus dichotomus]
MNIHILGNVMLPYVDENLTVVWKFHHDNDLRYATRAVKDWFACNAATVLDWFSCSPDLNTIERLWNDVKRSKAKISDIPQNVKTKVK